MTSEEIRTLVKSHLDAWAREDVEALTRNYAENCEVVSPMFHTVNGRAAVETSLRNLFRGLQQWNVRIDDLLVDCSGNEERAALVMTVQATQAGEMFGFPASGRRMGLQAVHLYRFENGQIVAERRLYDFSGLLMQLGVLKAKMG